MNIKKKAEIKKLLDVAQRLAQKTIIIKDYPSLLEQSLLFELRKEISFLNQALKNLTSFEERFKKRCIERDARQNDSVSFREKPDSYTNELYWNIAVIVFKPNTIAEMLGIIAPTVKKHLNVSFTEFLPRVPQNSKDLRKLLKNLEPKLTCHNALDVLKNEPKITEFSEYILCGDLVFNVADIIDLPFHNQVKLKEKLTKFYPDLAKKLYLHNTSFKDLDTDILKYCEGGIAPRDAILQLIKGLTLGGQRITKSHFASEVAEDAIKQFFNYFNKLSIETQSKLRKISGDYNLADIIDNEIGKGTCVETAASHLTTFLEDNTTNELLCSQMTEAALKQLEKKYQLPILKTKKDRFSEFALPKFLIKKVIQSSTLKIEKNEEIIPIFLKIHPEACYEVMINRLSREQVMILRNAFETEYFTSGQKQCFQKIIYNNVLDPLICEAINRNNPQLLQVLLEKYAPKDRLKEIIKHDSYGDTALHMSCRYPGLIKIIMNALPKEQLIAALRAKNASGSTAMSYILLHLDALEALVTFLSAEQTIEALGIKSETFSFWNYPRLEQLQNVLSILPESHRLSFLTYQLVTVYMCIELDDEITPVWKKFLADKKWLDNFQELYKDSFAPDFIRIMDFLNRHSTLGLDIRQPLFSQALFPYHVSKLLAKIHKKNSFIEIKKDLFKFIEASFTSQIKIGFWDVPTSRLSFLLLKDLGLMEEYNLKDIEQVLGKLKARWGLKEETHEPSIKLG